MFVFQLPLVLAWTAIRHYPSGMLQDDAARADAQFLAMAYPPHQDADP